MTASSESTTDQTFETINHLVDIPENTDGLEAQLKAMEDIVQLLEQGEVDLETSLALFEAGVHIQRRAQKLLASAEKRVEVLLENNDTIEREWLEETPDMRPETHTEDDDISF